MRRQEKFSQHLHNISSNLILEKNETLVVIIARRRNRIILNIDSIIKSLIYLGIPYAVVSLEEIPLLKQLEMMQKATDSAGCNALARGATAGLSVFGGSV